MKKIYIKPEIDNIEIVLSHICDASPNPDLSTGGDDKGSDGGNGFTEDAGSVRGDWENIWGNM